MTSCSKAWQTKAILINSKQESVLFCATLSDTSKSTDDRRLLLDHGFTECNAVNLDSLRVDYRSKVNLVVQTPYAGPVDLCHCHSEHSFGKKQC